MRRLIGPVLDRAGAFLADRGARADHVTLAGFALGACSFPCLAAGLYLPALGFIGLNRLCDGLDGAVARRRGATDLGGYLDIVTDFIFYAGVIFFFALGRPEDALPAAFLLFSFMGTASSFLAYAIFAAKRGLGTDRRGAKSFYYLGGLTEGTETIALLAAICLWPDGFAWLASGFGALCWLTALGRIMAARAAFG